MHIQIHVYNVKNMSSMFYECKNFNNNNQNINSWDVSNITDPRGAFVGTLMYFVKYPIFGTDIHLKERDNA